MNLEPKLGAQEAAGVNQLVQGLTRTFRVSAPVAEHPRLLRIDQAVSEGFCRPTFGIRGVSESGLARDVLTSQPALEVWLGLGGWQRYRVGELRDQDQMRRKGAATLREQFFKVKPLVEISWRVLRNNRERPQSEEKATAQ